ncbi:MAG TPA: hypothetical protein VI997_06420 [Candidatus Thermoplasmatota archaeon]|nr:hypothetical protein [Candidatus Thermoplasmatota archaeon]
MSHRAVLVALALVAVPFLAVVPVSADVGFPSGEHYNLNILGKEKVGKGVGGKDTGGRIFVPLYGTCRIMLTEGTFLVKDADCVKDAKAAFQLPNPDPDNDGASAYSVYIRPLAKPGGNAQFTTCFQEVNPDTLVVEEWCSSEKVVITRVGGSSPAQDVTPQATTVCYDSDGDGDLDREHIFADENKDYLWKYDNNGLRLAQLRFYPIPADISMPCPAA